MAVVAARMHLAFVARRVGNARAFGDVQRIHVGAQPDSVAAAPAAKNADDACLGEAGMNVQPDRFELACDVCARCCFLEGRFGMRVDMMPPITHLGVKRSNFWHDVHRFLAGGL